MANSRSGGSDGDTIQSLEKKPPASKLFSRRKTPKADTVVEPSEKGSEKSADSAEPNKQEFPPVSFSDLFRYSTRYELILNFFGIVAACAAGAAMPAMSLMFGDLANDFVNFTTIIMRVDSGDVGAEDLIPAAAASFRHNASRSALWITIIGIGMFICTYAYMQIWVYTGETCSKRIRERYLQAILRQDVAYFDNVGAGEVATRIQTDTHLVQQGISEKVALVAHFIATFISGFAIAYARSWRLALALSSMLPCIAIAGGVMAKFVAGYTQLSLKHVAEGGSIAEEVIGTIRTSHAFGTQTVLGKIYKEKVGKTLQVDLKAAIIHAIGFGVFFFVIYGGYGLAFSFGTTLILSGHANAGIVVNVFLAILIGSFSLALLPPESQAILNARGAAAKLFATIERVPAIDSADPNGLKPDTVHGEVSLENVSFNYPSRPTVPILRDLSIKFPAGKTAALVGASGSGKSTIISLVERFYDPLSGSVKLDGVDVKELNLKWLRRQIGLVSQEPVLFATTIRGNVAHGLIGTKWENASEEDKFALIKDACIKANADGFISKLPLGYETLVGERGFLLSGGQKQRVAIARAIVSDPRILLLDEATSALDTQSEGIVQDALDKAAAGRTTIIIAHRLSTIKHADTIYVMGDGKILESGTHDELLQREGNYHRLVQAQKLRESVTSAEGESEPSDTKQDIALQEDLLLTRKNTDHSLASEIIEQRRKESEPAHVKDIGLFALAHRLLPLIRDKHKSYMIGAFFACCSGAVYPSFGLVYAKGMEGFSLTDRHEMRKAGDRSALWFFVIAILSTIAIGFQNYLFADAATALKARLRALSFSAMLRQDIEFFDKEENSTGSLTSQLSENPQKVNGLAGITLGAIIQSVATVVVAFSLGLAFLWKVGLIAIACTPLLISSGYIRLKVVVMKDQVNKKAHEESAHLACEAAGSIRTIASLTREDDCLQIYSKSLEEPLRRSNRTSIGSNMLYALSQSFFFLVISLVFWYGAVLVSRRQATLFEFFVVLMSTVLGVIQAGNIFTFVPDMSSAQGAGSEIIRLLDSRPEIDAESNEGAVIPPESVRGHIRFDNIHFRYPTRPGVRVLRDLSLEVQPGTYVALVGASGSGKSTVIQLIERFYDPLAGDVYLDGQRITDLNVQEYRKHLALVSQEPTLYSGSVKFNILLGAVKPAEEVTQQELEEACRKANILEFIQELPQGFDTEVGGKGSQLSGGQKQRIAIARALLRNPKVLLLDEATSALDSNSEKVVQSALDEASKGRTTIAVAHRLSTIQNADRIYFIKEGKVSEYGTHDQLISRHGDYYDYVQLQVLSKGH